jgi:hypothetical protein
MGGDTDIAGSLDALVAGKRATPRVPVRMAAVIRTAREELAAVVHDVSRDGALLGLPLSALCEGDGPVGPAEQFALLERHFRESFDLLLPGQGVVVEAQVVRLVLTADASDALALGCCFVEPLGEEQQRALGLRDDEAGERASWGEATLEHGLRRVADPARPVSALLLDGTSAQAGPLHLGPVAAIGRDVLLVKLWGVSAEAVAPALAAGGFARVLRGSGVLLETPVELLATRYTDAPRPGLDVLLRCPDGVPRAVRRCFRRA